MPVPIKTNDYFKPIAVQGGMANQSARERLFGSSTYLQQQQHQQFIHQQQQNQIYQSLGIDDLDQMQGGRQIPISKPEVRSVANEK
jgi:hypothetical protein